MQDEHLVGLAVGDRVTHVRLNRVGTIKEMPGDGSVTVHFDEEGMNLPAETVTFTKEGMTKGYQGMWNCGKPFIKEQTWWK